MNVYSIVKEPEVLASLLIGEFFFIRTVSNFKKIKSSLQRKSELFRTFYVNLLKIGEKCDILINTEGIEY